MQKAIDPSIDAHLEAMKMMRPGLYEYQVAAKMVEIHAYAAAKPRLRADCRHGFNSTVLHYNKLDRKIEDGDIVLLDVAGQYSGYASDITRTHSRQRKIHGAAARNLRHRAGGAERRDGRAQARHDALPQGRNEPHKIAMDYIDSHGKDRRAARSAGTTFTA